MKVRIRFEKTGVMRFIGHLDLMRYFQKAIRRSGIAVTFSTGYSPHMIMSFAEPLGIGLTSIGDYFDLELAYADPYQEDPNYDDGSGRLAGTLSPCPSAAELLEKLNRQMAEGIRITKIVRIPSGRKGNAMASVAAAAYTVSFPRHAIPEDAAVTDLVTAFLSKEEIIAERKTKSGVKNENIRPHIYTLKETGLPAFDADGTDCALAVLCAAGSAANLKAEVVLRAFLDFAGISAEMGEVHIRRDEMYFSDAENGLCPLYLAGKDF